MMPTLSVLKFRSISSHKLSSPESSIKTKLKFLIRKLIPILGIGKYVGSICGVSCFASTLGELKNRAAIALPGIGIFVHPGDINNVSLLRHEFGHILQARKWGKLFFYRYIAIESIVSARKSNQDATFIHQQTWTEWTANRLAYYFFKRPEDWDMKSYPTYPPLHIREGAECPRILRLEKQTERLRHTAI